MTAAPATICLSMIVKDEAHVIERCLLSVLPQVDAVAIIDTGSADATVKTILRVLHERGFPRDRTHVDRRPWVDFAHNRNEALDAARLSGCDYALVIDADEELRCDADPSPRMGKGLDADALALRLRLTGDADHLWTRRQVFRLSKPWRWEGRVHEACNLHEDQTLATSRLFWIASHDDSARNRDRRAKCLSDARVLTEMLAEDPDNARYWFYLAQALGAAGDVEAAILAYHRRLECEGWEEERFLALFRIAAHKMDLGHPSRDVVAAFLVAFEERPTRAEPLWALAHYLNEQGRHALAEVYARQACLMPMPNDAFGVSESIYQWRCADELVRALTGMGRHADALPFLERLEEVLRPCKAEHERASRNLEIARAACFPEAAE